MENSKTVIIIYIMLAIFSINLVSAQDKKERIGFEDITKTGINYYNYSDKDKVNYEVSIWGYVKSPGKYLIPEGTTFIDLMSLSGGPLNEAKLGTIRIIRLKNDSLNIKENKVILLNYSDFMSDEEIYNPKKQNPALYPGDVILIPGGPRYSFRDNWSIILTAVSTLTSITVLLITIFRN